MLEFAAQACNGNSCLFAIFGDGAACHFESPEAKLFGYGIVVERMPTVFAFDNFAQSGDYFALGSVVAIIKTLVEEKFQRENSPWSQNIFALSGTADD